MTPYWIRSKIFGDICGDTEVQKTSFDTESILHACRCFLEDNSIADNDKTINDPCKTCKGAHCRESSSSDVHCCKTFRFMQQTCLPACLLTNTWNAVESELSSLMPKAPFVVEGCRVLQHQTWQDERSGKSGMSSMWQYYACLALLGVCVSFLLLRGQSCILQCCFLQSSGNGPGCHQK